MLSKPCEFSVLSDHFANSFLITLSSENLRHYLSSKSNKLKTELITCSACEIALSDSFVQKSKTKYKCICSNEKLEKTEENEKLIQNQSKPDFFSLEKNDPQKPKPVLLMCCLDYSGSMSTQYIVPNDPSIKAYISERNQILQAKYDQDSSKNNSISRKEIILFHLRREIETLIENNPNRDYRIFVITFSKEITLYGDGATSIHPLTLNEGEFNEIKNDWKKCRSFGRDGYNYVYSSDSKLKLDQLFTKLENEESSGTTSLAPAIAAGLGVIAKIKPDACQFYIFTDGFANNGFGNIEESLGKPDQLNKCIKDYESLGESAFKLGVVFHLFTFSDEKAGMKITQKLIDKTFHGNLYRIQVMKNGSYDSDGFNSKLREALSISNGLFAIEGSLKICYNKTIKARFSKKSEAYSNTDKDGLLYKNIGAIYDNKIKIAVFYEIPSEKFNLDETVHFQIQLNFIRVDDRNNYTIVLNLYSQIKKEFKNQFACDFTILTNILVNDQIQLDQEKIKKYKEFLEKNGSAEDIKILENYLEEFDLMPKKENKISKEFVQKKTIKEEKKKNKFDSDSDSSDSDEKTMEIWLNQKNADKKLEKQTEKKKS